VKGNFDLLGKIDGGVTDGADRPQQPLAGKITSIGSIVA
jgi:hypothetical protein